jgi:uncharacterized protein
MPVDASLVLINPYTSQTIPFWVGLGLIVGFLSGLLGIGGGLQMVPGLVLIAPYFIGGPLVTAKAATGIAAVQAFASAISSTAVHVQNKTMKLRLVLMFGIPAIVGGYVGSSLSAMWSQRMILLILIIALAATLVLGVRKYIKTLMGTPEPETFIQEWDTLKKSIPIAAPYALFIGALAGIIGMGGAVFYVPFMTEIMKLPVRQAIINATGVVILTSLGSVIGKGQAGIIPWKLALLISAIAFVGGWLGAKVQSRVKNKHLRLLHLGLVVWAMIETIRKLMAA